MARLGFLAPLSCATIVFFAVLTVRVESASNEEFFEKEVRPLLVEHCLKCHGDKKPKGGLSLTSRDAILKGGDSGPAAVAGKAEKSLLIQAVRYNDTPQMPPKRKLPDRQIAVLTHWVELGLPWPQRTDPGATTERNGTFQITEEQRRFWSFQPMKAVFPPNVRDMIWPKSKIDRFILAVLESKGLRPAKATDKRTFSFDAGGTGGEMDCADAWRRRDWMVQAFNLDLPYDEFLTHQTAGDLLPSPNEFNREGIIATGLLALGNWGGGDADKEKLLTNIADDQVDAVSRTFMGLAAPDGTQPRAADLSLRRPRLKLDRRTWQCRQGHPHQLIVKLEPGKSLCEKQLF
jgi:hypothetical protein